MWQDEQFGSLRIGFQTNRLLFKHQSPYQLIEVFETVDYGTILRLDGTWQCSTELEHTYHEMIVHPALTTAPSIENVLIVGGGDGGTAREVLRYPEVRNVDLVEIDSDVVKACKEHLSSIGEGAWDEPRLNLIIGDGIQFVRDAHQKYDVIIVDGSDPIGPSVGLFNSAFFESCARALKSDGVLVTQAESPRVMLDNHIGLIQTIRQHFENVAPYYQGQIIYPGGVWSWIYASQNVDRRKILRDPDPNLMIYNTEIHQAAFAIPNYVQHIINRH